ncbi:L,D-transpeptidase [Priestia endophytica]|uniref:L,D-transpeptidase n=1 Tax=Priestia endophytica TaxID=135735 RepID=UPI002280C247|nr:L,D-transpeptidase [Priestia endophytica]MCY8235270.1 L,D-transpeptidase [Priestia endophytica]
MKNMLLKLMAIFTLLMVTLCGVTRGKTEASAIDHRDLIIINKYYNKIAYFHDGYLEMVEPVATGKRWDKTLVGFLRW